MRAAASAAPATPSSASAASGILEADHQRARGREDRERVHRRAAQEGQRAGARQRVAVAPGDLGERDRLGGPRERQRRPVEHDRAEVADEDERGARRARRARAGRARRGRCARRRSSRRRRARARRRRRGGAAPDAAQRRLEDERVREREAEVRRRARRAANSLVDRRASRRGRARPSRPRSPPSRPPAGGRRRSRRTRRRRARSRSRPPRARARARPGASRTPAAATARWATASAAEPDVPGVVAARRRPARPREHERVEHQQQVRGDASSSLRVRSSKPTAATTASAPKPISTASAGGARGSAVNSHPTHCRVASAKLANASQVQRCHSRTPTAEAVASEQERDRRADELGADERPARRPRPGSRAPRCRAPPSGGRATVAVAPTAKATGEPGRGGDQLIDLGRDDRAREQARDPGRGGGERAVGAAAALVERGSRPRAGRARRGGQRGPRLLADPAARDGDRRAGTGARRAATARPPTRAPARRAGPRG